METSSHPTVRSIGWLATGLVIIGALNWGLVGLFGFNLVVALSGRFDGLPRVIYALVGLAGLYEIYFARVLSHESPAQRFARAVS
jgi:uncharacterized membrane protein YuzA (DUF378 family)